MLEEGVAYGPPKTTPTSPPSKTSLHRPGEEGLNKKPLKKSEKKEENG